MRWPREKRASPTPSHPHPHPLTLTLTLTLTLIPPTHTHTLTHTHTHTHTLTPTLTQVDWAVASRSHGLAWFIVKKSHDPSLWRDLDRGAEYEEVAAGAAVTFSIRPHPDPNP